MYLELKYRSDDMFTVHNNEHSLCAHVSCLWLYAGPQLEAQGHIDF